MKDNKKCWDCYYFLTKKLTKETFIKSNFSSSLVLEKRFSNNDNVEIYWCKLGEGPKLITLKKEARRAYKDNCPQRSE